jgi:class 3 adenylate cyclase
MSTLKASKQGLELVDRARRRKGWTKTRTLAWWQAAHTSQATVRRFWRGIAIDRETFIAICLAVGLTDWQAIAENTSLEEQDLLTTVNLVSEQVVSEQDANFSLSADSKRLAAIVFTDVVEFSTKMESDEIQTIKILNRDFQIMQQLCADFGGKVIKSNGDGLLMYFTSAIQAVNCAIAIQTNFADQIDDVLPHEVLFHRIGIHLGDIFVNAGDVIGNGVNIAARLQAECEPMGVCISQSVYDTVKGNLTAEIIYGGLRNLKNIVQPVPVYNIICSNRSQTEVFALQKQAVGILPVPLFQQDWNESPDLTDFYGREDELGLLETWLISDRCKVVSILGIGGIGKTSLAVACADRLQDKFDRLIWRSLQSAPTPREFLQDLLRFFANAKEPVRIDNWQQGINQLIDYCQQYRCLLIIDGLEAIFLSSEGKVKPQTGFYQTGYEAYGEILKRLASDRHQSCLLLTSREKLAEVAMLEGTSAPVRSLGLRGLEIAEVTELFKAKGCHGSERELQEITALYGGNPLALKMIAATIHEVFGNDVRAFLQENTIVIGDRMRSLLKQQIDRLSELEKEILYWLTIEREPLTLARLRDDLLMPPPFSQIFEVLSALERRSLIEKVADEVEVCFTLQPFLMKYLLEELVEQILEEFFEAIESQDIDCLKLFRTCALVKPKCQNLADPNEARLLSRLRNGILRAYRSEKKIQLIFDFFIPQLQGKSALIVGYAGSNFLSLVKVFGVDYDRYDWGSIYRR